MAGSEQRALTKELRDWLSKVSMCAQDIMREVGAIRGGHDRWVQLYEARDELGALLASVSVRKDED